MRNQALVLATVIKDLESATAKIEALESELAESKFWEMDLRKTIPEFNKELEEAYGRVIPTLRAENVKLRRWIWELNRPHAAESPKSAAEEDDDAAGGSAKRQRTVEERTCKHCWGIDVTERKFDRCFCEEC